METVVGVKGIDEPELNESSVQKHCSCALQSPKPIDESVVYKLVRVQGDGRFVPATEDEVMEVKDLLEGDKMENDGIEDLEQTMECISCEEPYSGELPMEDSEGLKVDNTEEDSDKLNGRLEFIGKMLQKVQEEKVLLAYGSPDHSSAYTMKVDIQCSDQHHDFSAIDKKLQSGFLQQENSLPSLSGPSDNYATQSKAAAECSNFSDEPLGSLSSASAVCITSKPPINGEICLEMLSIRELHETFKATFGRETTVKDKQWLKRRISMGLSNSCDVSTTSFIFRNNKWTKKVNEQSCKSVDGAHIMEESCSVDGTVKDSIVGAIDNSCRGPPINHNNIMEDHQTAYGEMLGNTLDYGHANDNLQSVDRAAKRVRKPTKRYIEELSEVESRDITGKLLSPGNDSGQGQTLPISNVRHVRNVISDARAVVTRTDSLGGSGIQIPYVSRVRRSRPRKNVLSLMKLNPRSTSITAKLVNKALGVHNSEPNEIGYEVLKAKSPQKFQQQLVPKPEKVDQCLASDDHCLASDDQCLASDDQCLASDDQCLASDDQCLASHTGDPEKDDRCLALDTVDPEKNDRCLVLDTVEPEKNDQCLASDTVVPEKNDQCPKDEAKLVDSTGDASDDNIVTVPTSKGGMRRKHHRAWTISEVVKLVDGVSMYGAGRWSEIKRISFASSSHRTSVDLKDKWRNLLRASLAQTPPDNGINSRKQASTPPIPAPILLRVRELAEMHAQVPPNLSSGKMVESIGSVGARSVHDTRSGYL